MKLRKLYLKKDLNDNRKSEDFLLSFRKFAHIEKYRYKFWHIFPKKIVYLDLASITSNSEWKVYFGNKKTEKIKYQICDGIPKIHLNFKKDVIMKLSVSPGPNFMSVQTELFEMIEENGEYIAPKFKPNFDVYVENEANELKVMLSDFNLVIMDVEF